MTFSFILIFSCSYIISSNDTKNTTINQDIGKIRSTGSKFYPIISFGHDKNNNVHGIWFIVNSNQDITAFYSRDPNNGCNLSYRRDLKMNNMSPVFFNECDKTYFNEYGEQLSNQIKQLDEFEVRAQEEKVEVSINQVKYGICNQNNVIDESYCSTISVNKYGKPKHGRQIGQR
tara:strand:+ start:3511 stop:4032 length:522 start_codon:yes stop_codon:yes gene_type:complete